MHSVSQSAQDPVSGKFVAGNNANPVGRWAARKAKLGAKMAEVAVEFGGVEALSSIDRALVEQAAALMLRHPTNDEDATRIANTVARLLRSVRRDRVMREPTFHEALAARKAP